MSVTRQLNGLRLALGSSIRGMSSAQASTSKKFYDVPEGHSDSDLSQVACNIGLNRRRDLSLGAAGNIKLNIDGKPQNLADLFKRSTIAPLLQGKKSVIFGVPDCGKVCSEQHVPGYLKEWDNLRKLGISQILCVAVDEPSTVNSWGKKVAGDGSKITFAADTVGALTRILGMEMGDPKATGVKSLRYAGIVEDGVLLKLVCCPNNGFLITPIKSIKELFIQAPIFYIVQKVDASPAQTKESSASSIVALLKTMQ